MKRFADRLREARVAVGLTQEQLGFALGVSKSSVSAWENGREAPSFRLLPALRHTLKRSLDELIEDGAQQAARPSEMREASLMAQNEKERALLLRYRALSARRREALLELIKPGREDDEPARTATIGG